MAPRSSGGTSESLSNGGFEQDLAGWTAVGNMQVKSSAPYVAAEGVKIVAFNAANQTPNGNLSQVFQTVPGTSYTLRFSMGVFSYGSNPQKLRVEVRGTDTLISETLTMTGPGGGGSTWSSRSFAFVADGVSTVLAFTDQSATSDATDLLLDGVSVTSTSSGPEEPPVEEPEPPVDVARIMPLGDSITRGTNDINYPNGSIPGGYRKPLGSALATAGLVYDFVGSRTDNAATGMDPDHNGNDGFRTDQMLSNIGTWLEVDPHVVLLHAGSNDILQNVPVATVADNLGLLIDAITTSAPHRRLYVATIIPITQDWNGQSAAVLNANADDYNTRVRTLVSDFSASGRNVSLVEMNSSIVLTNPDPSLNFYQPGDGIHPGQAGYNQMGEIWFNSVSAGGSLFEIPEAPSGLTASVDGAGNADLSWVDHSTFETGFRIERETGGSGGYVVIATVSPDVTTYLDEGLVSGTTYRYRVSAIHGTAVSSPSNVAVVGTFLRVSYQEWSATFPDFDALPGTDRAPAADANGDGVPNLIAFACGLDPLLPAGPDHLPVISGGNDGLFFSYIRSKTADAIIAVVASPDLAEGSWEPVEAEETVEDLAGDPSLERVTIPVGIGSETYFVRLRVVID